MRKREIEECRVSYLFREMWGHTGGASRNRKHCKLKGKHPVRAFGKYQHSVRLLRKHLADSRRTTGRRSCLALPPPDLHSHAVLADSCTIAVHACVDTLTFWSAGVLTRIGRVVAYSLTLLAWIFLISDCFTCIHIYFHPLGSYWTLTRSSISLFSAGCRGCLVAHAEL